MSSSLIVFPFLFIFLKPLVFFFLLTYFCPSSEFPTLPLSFSSPSFIIFCFFHSFLLPPSFFLLHLSFSFSLFLFFFPSLYSLHLTFFSFLSFFNSYFSFFPSSSLSRLSFTSLPSYVYILCFSPLFFAFLTYFFPSCCGPSSIFSSFLFHCFYISSYSFCFLHHFFSPPNFLSLSLFFFIFVFSSLLGLPSHISAHLFFPSFLVFCSPSSSFLFFLPPKFPLLVSQVYILQFIISLILCIFSVDNPCLSMSIRNPCLSMSIRKILVSVCP